MRASVYRRASIGRGLQRPFAGREFQLILEFTQERRRRFLVDCRYYGDGGQLQAATEVISALDGVVEEFEQQSEADAQCQAEGETDHRPQRAIRACRRSRRPRRLDHAQVVLLLGEFEIGFAALLQEIPVKRLGRIDLLLKYPVLERVHILFRGFVFGVLQRPIERLFIADGAIEVELQFNFQRLAMGLDLLSDGGYLLLDFYGLRVVGAVIHVKLRGLRHEIAELFLKLRKIRVGVDLGDMFDAPPSDVFIERLFDDAVGLGPRDFGLQTQEAVGAQRSLALWRDVGMRAGVICQRLFGPLSPGLELARRAVQPTRRVLEFPGLV